MRQRTHPGTLDKARKNFGVGSASLGLLSEGVAVFDPEPLKEIAQELFNQLPDVSAGRRHAQDSGEFCDSRAMDDSSKSLP